METLDELVVGDRISFTTINPKDNNTYEGTITSICDYTIASKFADLIPTYETIKKVDSTLDPVDELSYFILNCIQSDISSTVVVAKEWINLTSIVLLDGTEYFDIRIYDRYSSADQAIVLELLNSNGFKCVTL